jgi:diguanylate cyclase (GGDEF)-like protein/PAS domain S-box-containing protein
LKDKVFLSLWGCVVVLTGYLAWILGQEYAATRERSRSEALSLARLVAESANASFRLVDLSLRHTIESMPSVNLEHTDRLSASSRDNVQRYLMQQQERTPGVVSMSLTDARGIVFANTVGSTPGTNLGDRPYFLALRAGDGHAPVISEAVRGRVSGKWGIQVARRIEFPDGRFAGMLVANLGIEEHFGAFFKSLQLGAGAAVSLWDRDQRLLVRYPVVDGTIGKDLKTPELIELLQPDHVEAVFSMYSPVDGKQRIAGTRQLQDFPLNAVVALDEAASMATWRDSLRNTTLLILALTVAAALATQTIIRRRRAEDRLRQAASVFSHAHEGIMITDAQSRRILDVNVEMEVLTGFSRAELIGSTPSLFDSGHHDLKFFSDLRKSLLEQGSWRGDIWNRRKDGALYVQHTRISAVMDESGYISHYVAMCSDITAVKEEQSNLERMAFHDPLTQLPNRLLLSDRLQQAINTNQREGTLLALCYLDLDDFKPVNDRHGHAVGDQLLVNVASRLRASVRGGDTVARIGGDEFVILLNGMTSTAECEAAMSRLHEAITTPYALGNVSTNVSASIGVAIYPRDATNGEDLMLLADSLLYRAKNAGRRRSQFAI